MATGAYDANGIWQYGEDDNIALFSDLLKLGTASTSSAFTADRARLATLEAGSLSGLIPLSPVSVTAVTGTAAVNSLGVITVTSCTKVILNGIFTSGYKRYKIVYQNLLGTLNTSLLARFTSAGTESSASYYEALGNIYATAGFTNGSSQNIAQIQIGLLHNAGAWGSGFVEISNIATTSHTTHNTLHSGYDSSSQTRSVFGGGFHNVSTSYDGISILANTGNYSGTFQVFGYND